MFCRKIALGVFIFINVTFPAQGYAKKKSIIHEKPNILIISACSLRKKNIKLYGYEKDTMPNLTKFARKSYIFKNAYSNFSWMPLAIPALIEMSKTEVAQYGYTTLGGEWGPYVKEFIKINKMSYPSEFHIHVPKEQTIDHLSITGSLKKLLQKKRKKPFFLTVHIKFMHFPYFVPSNDLSHDQRKLYKTVYENDFLANIEQLKKMKRLKNRKPFEEVFFGDFTNATNDSPGIIATRYKNIHNKNYLAQWQATANYQQELSLIQDAYDKKLQIFDSIIKDLLNLYNIKHLKQNTIVIFTGDHGQSFMEHGHLIHGETVYDEMLTFPLLIKFPSGKSKVSIEKQISPKSVGDIVKKIMQGKLSSNNFTQFLDEKIEDRFVTSRNCSETSFSVRYKNQWKYIYNFNKSVHEVYNLEKDPGEQLNVYDLIPNKIRGLLQEHLFKAMLEINTSTKNNRKLLLCKNH